MTPGSPPPATLVAALEELREVVRRAALPLELPGVEAVRAQRDQIADQLDDYVLPRLRQIDAPLLAVVGGSTGAGKSTLVNSLVGTPVTQTGVLRPTTRSPVLVHHPADADWFDATRILPELSRTTGGGGDPRSLRLVATPAMPQGLAILDAPDIDSVERGNRVLASQLLAAADLWLFVTSAARYADQVPWEFLRAAAERSAAVAIVLDRTPPEALWEVRNHLARMLRDRGLRESRLFAVTEGEVSDDGVLPPEQVAEVREWLDALAADAEARAGVVRQTLEGAMGATVRRTHELADAVTDQAAAAAGLTRDAETAYAEATRRVDEACADGSLLRGEVLLRWQEFVGAGKVLRALESRAGWLRDRVGAVLSGRPAPAERVSVAVESGLETLVVEHAEAAAERTETVWRSHPAGKALLDGPQGRDLGRASRDFRQRTERAVRDWQRAVLELVRTEGADKRATARFLAIGVNGLAVALMMVVFVHTGGVTGTEVGVAGGSAAVGQMILNAVFGDDAVRRLAAQARADLEERVAALMASERDRFLAVLHDAGLDPELAEELREAADRVEELRGPQPGPA